MGRREDNILANPTRIVRLNFTREQIDLLVNYALHNGYEPKHPSHQMDMHAQNSAVKWSIMSRLGFEN
jgi:hypothetical protein